MLSKHCFPSLYCYTGLLTHKCLFSASALVVNLPDRAFQVFNGSLPIKLLHRSQHIVSLDIKTSCSNIYHLLSTGPNIFVSETLGIWNETSPGDSLNVLRKQVCYWQYEISCHCQTIPSYTNSTAYRSFTAISINRVTQERFSIQDKTFSCFYIQL